MQKISAWLFLLISVLWLLPLISIDIGKVDNWLQVIALAVIAVLEIVLYDKK